MMKNEEKWHEPKRCLEADRNSLSPCSKLGTRVRPLGEFYFDEQDLLELAETLPEDFETWCGLKELRSSPPKSIS